MTLRRQRPYFLRVADGVHILDPAVGADSMAVIGAMMSRTADLGAKYDQVAASDAVTLDDLIADVLARSALLGGGSIASEEREHMERLLRALASRIEEESWDFSNPPAKVREFLASNLAGYGHASIASMAKAVFLFLSGFGWPAAWLLEDTPLFDGQEVSTRAVDAETIPGAAGAGTACRYAPPILQALHARWMAVYNTVKREATGGGWKYDDARVFLPGTIPTGVVWTNDVRTIARQLDHIRGLGGAFAALADQGYAGLDAAAPVTTTAIGRRDRRAFSTWTIGQHVLPAPLSPNAPPEVATQVTAHDGLMAGDEWATLLAAAEHRPRYNTHLDPLWRRAPRFRFSTVCSVAVARDWHRHRPLMPWTLEVVTDAAGDVQLAPWYRMDARLPEGLLAETRAAFRALGGLPRAGRATDGPADGVAAVAAQWQALHALPFGALVRLSCVATLPDLVYMLELRATVKGANAEYQAQARRALAELCAELPADVVAAEHLDGALSHTTGLHVV